MSSPPEDTAFKEFVQPHLPVLLRVARSLTGSWNDAEDLVQNTLVRALRALDRFDGRHPRAWLLTIMRNAHLNEVRRKRPDLVGPEAVLDPLESNDDTPSAADPEKRTLESHVAPELLAAYAALPKRFRDVVQLVDLDGLSYSEAAEILDIPIGTVMSRLHRARRRMRRSLEQAGIGDPGSLAESDSAGKG